MKKRSEKRVSRKDAKGAKVTGRGRSSRADARDLTRRFLALLETRISPDVYPELAEGVEMTKVLSLRAWGLGAKTFFVTSVASIEC